MTLLKDIYDRLSAAVGSSGAGATFPCPKTVNKGMAGFLVEMLAGIPQTSNCLDCEDGEVKSFPLKRLRGGALAPKETIAVTMLQPAALATTAFADSNAYRKLANCLYIPYIRDDDATVTLFRPLIFAVPPESAVYRQLEEDYGAIVAAAAAAGGSLAGTSGLGVYLQNRTKGAGHGSVSRAFYLRPAFIKAFLMDGVAAPPASEA